MFYLFSVIFIIFIPKTNKPMQIRLSIFLVFFLPAINLLGQTQMFQHGNRTNIWHFKAYEDRPEGAQKMLARRYFSVHYPMMFLAADQRYTRGADPQNPAIDTFFKLKKNSGFGLGASVGGYAKLGQLRNGALIALDYSIGYDIYTWRLKEIYFPGAGNVVCKASSSQFSLPLLIVYKHGPEADLSREKRFFYSAGGGIEPDYVKTKYMTVENKGFKFRPVLMGEVGVLSGMAWKFRVAYYPLPVEYMDNTGKNLPSIEDGSLTHVKATGSSGFVLSIMLLPYSRHWGR
jgi:hypothetical protein